MIAYVLILLALILANGLFAMSEIAMVSARHSRLRQMADEGSIGASVALDLASTPGRFLATIQIGITMVGVVAGAFGEATLAREIEPALANLSLVEPHSSILATAIVVIAVTYATLVIGELAPKNLALRYSEGIAATVAPLMRIVAIVATPAVWLLDRSERVVTAPFHRSRETSQINRGEIAILMDQWYDEGVLETTERELVEGLFELGERPIESMLKPRPDVQWLDMAMEPEQLAEAVRQSMYSVLPVAEGSFDTVVGTVNVRNLLISLLEGEELDLREHLEEPLFVPSCSTALKLMESFGERHTHMAVAVDDHGVPEGIVTLTDLMQVIVGPLASLSEDYSRRLRRIEPQRWVVDAMISLHEFEERLGIEVDPDERAHFRTVAGLILNLSEDIPSEGDTLTYRGLKIHVDRMDGQRIDQITVTREDQAEDEVEAEDAPESQ